MTKKCVYYNCSNNSYHNPGISLFCFPSKTEIRDIWIKNCGNVKLFHFIGNPQPLNKCWCICEQHFKEIYVLQVQSSKRLVKHAIPFQYGSQDGSSTEDNSLAFGGVKIEEIKQEACDALHSAEDTVDHIKTEEGEVVGVEIQTSNLAKETSQGIKEFQYDSDATTDSDVILERMENEQIQMENQSIVEDKNESVETRVQITEPDDKGDLQLTEEFHMKGQNNATSDVLPVSSTGKKIQEEEYLTSGLRISSVGDPRNLSKYDVGNRTTDGKPYKDSKYEGSAHSFLTQNNISSTEIALDDNISETHSNSIVSVITGIFECADCTYKTTVEKKFDKHILKHCGRAPKLKLVPNTCVHCKMTFRKKHDLDVHTVRKHPEFIASVSCMIYECTICSFKTATKYEFTIHMFRHVFGSAHKTCMHCNAQFRDIKRLDEHIINKHLNFISSVSSKVHGCTVCTFKTVYKSKLDTHIISMHPETCDYEISKCIHCNVPFKRKMEMNEHILRKHPSLVSISNEIYECMNCEYKTGIRHNLVRHMLQHFYMPDHTCIRCNRTFKSKIALEDHILKKHPSLIAFVTLKIYSCEYCTYKTTYSYNLARHNMLSHLETLKSCVHCEAKFKRAENLNNHIIKTHPEFIASLPCKIFECTKCTFKTTSKEYLSRHSLVHSDASNSCVHCGEVYRSKRVLYDHILREHSHFTPSIPSKIHKCTECSFKTALKTKLALHMLKHPGVASGFKFSKCIECNATFRSKSALDDHIIKNHPNLIGSVTTKINECTFCTFKTTKTTNLFSHLRKHPEAADNPKITTCKRCNKRFHYKVDLEDHILRKHPMLISTVSSKIYECANCSYKTTLKRILTNHMTKHPKKGSRKVEYSEED